MKMKEELSPETTADAKEASSAVETIVMQRSRRTIMDGEVVDFAEGFREEDGVFGKTQKPVGFFHISASRSKVMVHRCEIWKATQLETFKKAMDMAVAKHIHL